MSEGWTEENALEFCSVQKDISLDTLMVSVGESCLLSRGGNEDAKRCKVAEKEEDKIWYGMVWPSLSASSLSRVTSKKGLSVQTMKP